MYLGNKHVPSISFFSSIAVIVAISNTSFQKEQKENIDFVSARKEKKKKQR